MSVDRKSLIKSLTWRAMGFSTLGVISWLVTGNPVETGGLTLAFNAIQIPLYYLHERLYEK